MLSKWYNMTSRGHISDVFPEGIYAGCFNKTEQGIQVCEKTLIEVKNQSDTWSV